MTDQTPIKWILYEPSKTTVTRIIPELAVEIGLNESIILLQISFWISTCDNLRDGKYWTYQSLREMKEKAFPYWSHETIRKAVNNLQKAGYLLFGNYNQNKYDKTQWFALEPDKCSSLKSVLCAPAKKEVSEEPVKKLDTLSENLTRKTENLTTIPETTTESNTLRDVSRGNDTTDKTIPLTKGKPMPDAVTQAVKHLKTVEPKRKAIPASEMNPMKDAIAAVFNYSWETMTGTEKGLVQRAAKDLCEVKVTPDEIPSLYAYCKRMFTSFKPMALPGNVSEWRKTKPSNIVRTDGYIPVEERTSVLDGISLL